MVLIILGVVVGFSVYDFTHIHINRDSFFFISLFFLLIFWFTRRLAETNRTPFDFSEGESELVSGFNTEYRGGGFAFIFIGEYINIIIIGLVTRVLFFSFSFIFFLRLRDFLIFFITFFFSVLFILIRGSFPRVRYDWLIKLVWKGLLPFSLGALIIIILKFKFL